MQPIVTREGALSAPTRADSFDADKLVTLDQWWRAFFRRRLSVLLAIGLVLMPVAAILEWRFSGSHGWVFGVSRGVAELMLLLFWTLIRRGNAVKYYGTILALTVCFFAIPTVHVSALLGGTGVAEHVALVLTICVSAIVVPVQLRSHLTAQGLLLVYYLAAHMALLEQPGLPVSVLTGVLSLIFASAIAIFSVGSYERFQKTTVAKYIQANRQIQELASKDPLTNIANRLSFDAGLDHYWQLLHRAGSPLSLILADIDVFKAYNDEYGHVEGDECLKRVARVLTESARRGADIIARYGGEEFALVLPSTDAAGALVVAERVQENLAKEAILHQASPVSENVTISMGVVTLIPDFKRSPQTLVEAADKALYQSKEAGRNRITVGRPPMPPQE